MKWSFALVLALFLTACAPFIQRLTKDNTTSQPETGQSKGETPSSAGAQPVLSDEDSSKFNAAYQFVRTGSNDKDYDRALIAFEAYIESHPAGAHVDEAASWLALLRETQRAKEREQELGSLKKSLEEIEVRLHNAETERDALIQTKASLQIRADGLEQEKAALLREKSVAAKERDELSAAKTALENKVKLLTREKERLSAAKTRLEKRLRDLSTLDVQMEKMRKKVE